MLIILFISLSIEHDNINNIPQTITYIDDILKN